MDSVSPEWFTMTRLQSLDTLSCVRSRLVFVMGCSLLPTHTVVKTGILLNHIPRYQLELVALWDNLLMAVLAAGWKKPRANLPFVETSLPPMASTWPAVRASLLEAAEEHQWGVCKRRSPSNNLQRGGMEKSVNVLCSDIQTFRGGR